MIFVVWLTSTTTKLNTKTFYNACNKEAKNIIYKIVMNSKKNSNTNESKFEHILCKTSEFKQNTKIQGKDKIPYELIHNKFNEI